MSKFNTESNLCTCNNCGNIFIDQNPQVGAKRFMIDCTKVTDLQYLKGLIEHKETEYYWGCGICGTDAYLQDEIDEQKANKLGIICNTGLN